jgi:DNA-binding MarR family transcriptional regulator
MRSSPKLNCPTKLTGTLSCVPAAKRNQATERLERDTHINVILAAQRFTAGMQAICETGGVSQSQWGVLWVLCLGDEKRKGMPISQVADGLVTRAADASRLIDRLADAGLVERLANPADKRGVLVRATAKGRSAFKAIVPKLTTFHRQEWAELSGTELQTLNALLAKVLWGPTGTPTEH